MRAIKINLDELGFVLHRGREIKLDSYLNLNTGEIVNIPEEEEALAALLNIDIAEVVAADRQVLINRLLDKNGNYLFIPDRFHEVIFNMMSDFSARLSQSDERIKNELYRAIQSPGGFDTFHLLIRKSGLIDDWIAFRDDQYRLRCREWLDLNHIRTA